MPFAARYQGMYRCLLSDPHQKIVSHPAFMTLGDHQMAQASNDDSGRTISDPPPASGSSCGAWPSTPTMRTTPICTGTVWSIEPRASRRWLKIRVTCAGQGIEAVLNVVDDDRIVATD